MALYLCAFALLRIPAVQSVIADKVSEALSKTLGTKVLVGNVDIRLFNRLIVDNLVVYDQSYDRLRINAKPMLRVARFSAAIELLPLVEGEVSISSAQLFGMQANLYRKDAASPLNCQFVIDSLSSKDTTSHTPVNLNIASLVIRNGSVTFDQYDKPQRHGVFSPYHVDVSKLSSHIILYKLTDDSLNISVKRLSLKEKSGINIKNFSSNIIQSRSGIKVTDFLLSMPGTDIQIPELAVSYEMQGDSLKPGSLNYKGSIYAKEIDAKDFSPFLSPKVIAAMPRMTLKVSSSGTDRSAMTSLSLLSLESRSLALESLCKVTDILTKPSFDLTLMRCNVSESLLSAVTSQFSLPQQLARLGNVDLTGRVKASDKDNIEGNLNLSASRVGMAKLMAKYHPNYAKVHLETPKLNISQVVDDKGFGTLKCNIDAEARTSGGKTLAEVKTLADINGTVKGVINEVTYNDYTYHGINLDAALLNNTIHGKASVNDPNIRLSADGTASLGRVKSVDASISLKDFSPSTLNLTNAIGKKVLDATVDVSMKGTTIDDMLGTLTVSDVSVTDVSDPQKNAYLNNLSLTSRRLDSGEKEVTLNSDIADVEMCGNITITEIPQSITNIIAKELPSLPGLPAVKPCRNDLSVNVTVKDLTFVRRFVDIPVSFNNNVTLNGFVNSNNNTADLTLSAPDLNVKDNNFKNTLIHLWTPDGVVKVNVSTLCLQADKTMSLSLDCRGEDNNLFTSLSWDNMRKDVFRGTLNTVSRFYTDLSGKNAVKVTIPHSTFEVGDTLWRIHSQGVEYADGKVLVNHFTFENYNQHVYVDGVVSKNPEDSLVADFKDVNVEYVMDLINFHSVDFAGFASGRAVGHGVLGDLKAYAHLDVRDFLFEQGHMGTLHADAQYSNDSEQIDIDAVCDDAEANAKTIINGNISPLRNTLDLDIKAVDTRLEFMQSLCSSFMKDVTLRGNGRVRLYGPLSTINLTGSLFAQGDFTVSSTNCRYTMPGDTITFVPNDILFKGCPLQDKYGNMAYITGGVHHRYLGRISFDLDVETPRFLAYDSPTLDGSTFCGHAIIDGSIGLHGKGNEVNITADCTALKETYFVYDATSPDAIKSQDFITWGSMRNGDLNADVSHSDSLRNADDDEDPNNSGNDRTNIRMRFMVNATPEAKLHLIMDAITGDFIDLYGSGALRVNYFNKGSMEIFGNYGIDHGTYKMTIQNIIRRDFEFQSGGVIAFGGDPYNAVLKMQCAYNLNSVSLADLNIGTSFKANNVPVKCLMDITGTPAKPLISFNLDLPSLSTDARQMVYSIINSQDEMNQQVLYLLAIGRFYSQQQNTQQNTERIGQTTLAMQSFLSGTISQQFNNILNQAIGSNNWSFGANVTPGADGFSNAEYEGLLSGRLFNNRLIFNGQFGYRDNVVTNSQNFIGDFSLKYLLTPNGNFAVKVYNQANDRYFTRNSLNTQGVGLVLQKEFGK